MLVKRDKEKIIIINLSVLPIKFGFSLVVKSRVAPNSNERFAQKIKSSAV